MVKDPVCHTLTGIALVCSTAAAAQLWDIVQNAHTATIQVTHAMQCTETCVLLSTATHFTVLAVCLIILQTKIHTCMYVHVGHNTPYS